MTPQEWGTLKITCSELRIVGQNSFTEKAFIIYFKSSFKKNQTKFLLPMSLKHKHELLQQLCYASNILVFIDRKEIYFF